MAAQLSASANAPTRACGAQDRLLPAARRAHSRSLPHEVIAAGAGLVCCSRHSQLGTASARRGVAAAASGAAASTAAAAPAELVASNQLPRSPGAMVDQAAVAVQTALDAGQQRQMVTLLLPVNEKESDFNNTEPLDYPCSLQKEFDVCCALTKSLMQRLLGADAPINAKRIDDGGVEGEPCAVLFTEDRTFLAVVYPTADRLKQLQAFAKETRRPMLIVNPQWRNEGQVVSDFGIGPWRKAAEDFLATFAPTYVIKEKRIGSPGTVDAATGTRFVSGGVIRLLRQYPGQYQAYAMAPNGSSQLLESTEAEPGYKDLDAMIKRGRQAKLEIFAIAQRVTAVYAPAASGSSGSEDAEQGAGDAAGEGEGEGEGELGGLSDADIEAMDAATLRRLLLARGLPASGKISKLRERLREARDA